MKPMAPRSLSYYISSLLFPSHLVYYLQSLLSNLYKKIPKIFTLLSLLDRTFTTDREGIDNPFIALGASWCLFVVFGDLCIVSYWIDTLVLKIEGNTYATLLHHSFLFKGKPMHAQEVADTVSCSIDPTFPKGDGEKPKRPWKRKIYTTSAVRRSARVKLKKIHDDL